MHLLSQFMAFLGALKHGVCHQNRQWYVNPVRIDNSIATNYNMKLGIHDYNSVFYCLLSYSCERNDRIQ